MKKKQTLIFLLGEAELVEEFGMQCLEKGYTVMYKISSSERKKKFPRGFTPANAVPRNAVAAVELTNNNIEQKKKNLRNLEQKISAHTLLLSSSVTVTVTEQSSWLKQPSRLVGFAAFPTLISNTLIELAPSVHTEKKQMVQTAEFFSSLGKETAIVQDRIGMVMPRMLCQLINEAFFAVMEGIASPADIDTAMKLGTNYPYGPLEWASRIGVHNVEAVLRALHNDLHEERYRIAPLLQQMAIGKQWWKN